MTPKKNNYYNYKNIYEITASSFNQRNFNTIEKDNLRVGELINKNNFGIIELDKTNIERLRQHPCNIGLIYRYIRK